MTVLEQALPPDASEHYTPSPAGPVGDDEPLRPAPGSSSPAVTQTIRFIQRPLAFQLGMHAQLGETFHMKLQMRPAGLVLTSHPDHIKSLFTAKPADVPTVTSQSPLRPILGPSSVLTLNGDAHMRQRKLLLPPFHGEAVRRYTEVIEEATDRELSTWRGGETFALAPRMSAVTLDVIMSGVFGIEGRPTAGTPEHALRESTRWMLNLSTKPGWQLVELSNMAREEPNAVLARVLNRVDRDYHAIIRRRRAEAADDSAQDVLSLLLAATDEDGIALTDDELRDELLTLVVAGHETTANQLAWTFERLVRAAPAYDRLREEVRGGQDDAYVDATVHESMRVRPVIPMVGRVVQRPWRFGDYVFPAGSVLSASIVGVHHRPDIYPEPLAFRPERFLDRKPGTYTWIPFGGGTRRCLGAALALAEQRIVVRRIAERFDLAAPSPHPERARQRNVTMIPTRGGRVTVRRVRAH